MDGLMMDFQLTIPTLVRRAEALYGAGEIVTRLPDRSLRTLTYGDVLTRARRLATALRRLGVRSGDRVATFCWNHHQHLECYYGVPSMGGVLHTLNIRLAAEEVAYIANHAEDRVVLVDEVLLPVFERVRPHLRTIEEIVVVEAGSAPPDGMLDYETLLAAAEPDPFDAPIDERQAAGLCYTSGTTGRPKGVLYSHRSQLLHTLVYNQADLLGFTGRDTVLPVVPMFHANAWGTPYSTLICGARQVQAGPHLDPASLVDLLVRERVTLALGVPTIWMGILQELDRHRGEYDLSSLRAMLVGGAAVPEAMIRAYRERHGLQVIQGWGMTETSPVASVSIHPPELAAADADARYAYAARAGRPMPFVETRVVTESGVAPWDDRTMGELHVRGPWVAASYYGDSEGADRFTDDGWFKTGDIVTIEPGGSIAIRDRSKDVIKSGGEWISSVALENALMSHPAVAEAAVVGLPHPRWDERPLAVVVRRDGCDCTPDDLLRHLLPLFPRWWMPNGFEFVSAIPRTSVGKFQKTAIRERFRGYFTAAAPNALLADEAAAALVDTPVPRTAPMPGAPDMPLVANTAPPPAPPAA